MKTNFGFSTIGEYGPLLNYLVSSINLPDGSADTFAYEQNSACTPLSGTTSCTTGRLASVTLPTGGVVSYTYSSGPNNTGIESDGSAAQMTRSLTGSGNWQYSRTINSGTPGPGSTWTTTVTDPASNKTAINFAEDGAVSGPTYALFETQRQVYQGSATLLATSTTCYNGNYSGCATATVTSPISQTDAYYLPASGSTRLTEIQYNGSFSGSGLVSQKSEYDWGATTGSAPGNTHLIRRTNVSSCHTRKWNHKSSVNDHD